MGIFDIFKSKDQRQVEATVSDILGKIFPGGETDVLRDVDRIRRLTKAKIPQEKLRGFVQGCKTLVYISQTHTESSFVKSFKIRSENLISEAEAKDVYAYLAGETAYLDNMARIMPGAVDPAETRKTFGSGTYNDTIEGAHGAFGTSVTNPVPSICVRSSIEYLACLRLNGQLVQSTRVGSTSSPVTAGSIDMYELCSAGRDVGTIYICPYHKNTSKLAPVGFTLA